MIKMNDFLRSATYLAKATLREKSFTFWVLLFPLLLATFYHVALSNVFTFKVESIPVAVQEESFAAYVFPETGLFDITLVENDEEGIDLLEAKKVEAYVNKDSEMVVTSLSGVKPSIIRSILSQMEQIMLLGEDANYLDFSNSPVQQEEQKTNPMAVYFYSLFAMACFYSMFGAISSCIIIQPNLSTLGARLNSSPFKKSTFILSSFFVTMSLTMIANLLLYAYVVYILKVQVFLQPLESLLLVFMGNLCGTALGYALGAIEKLKEATKIMIAVLLTNFLAFAAGMMSLNIRFLVYKFAPLFAKYNPMSILTDTLYQVNNLANRDNLLFAISVLGVYALLALALATLLLRRNRYDSL